jgi:hypothetical protein
MGMRPLMQGFDAFRQNIPAGLVDSLPDDVVKVAAQVASGSQ